MWDRPLEILLRMSYGLVSGIGQSLMYGGVVEVISNPYLSCKPMNCGEFQIRYHSIAGLPTPP